MFVIEAGKGRRSWISGIFEDEEQANEFIRKLPSEMKLIKRKVPLQGIQYPFYIIEEGLEFIYLNHLQIGEILDGITKVEDDDRVYFNLYYITQDFEPKIPGSDYMGAIKHLHIDNSFLNSYATYGKDL